MVFKLENTTGYILIVHSTSGEVYFISPHSYRKIDEEDGTLSLAENHFSMHYGYCPVVFENGKIYIVIDGQNHSIVNYTYKLVQELKAKDSTYYGQT